MTRLAVALVPSAVNVIVSPAAYPLPPFWTITALTAPPVITGDKTAPLPVEVVMLYVTPVCVYPEPPAVMVTLEIGDTANGLLWVGGEWVASAVMFVSTNDRPYAVPMYENCEPTGTVELYAGGAMKILYDVDPVTAGQDMLLLPDTTAMSTLFVIVPTGDGTLS